MVRSRSIHWSLWLGLLIFVHWGRAQTTLKKPAPTSTTPNSFESQDLPHQAEIALDRIQHNDVGTGIVDATQYIELSAHADSKRVIPVLEAYFAKADEQDLRNEIASVLVSIGDPDPRFWGLILAQAESALADDSPDPFAQNAAGKSAPCSSPEFLTWAQAKKLSPKAACRHAAVTVSQELLPLADSGDPRSIPVLRRALEARNTAIRAVAVKGLVLARDRDSIPLIVQLIRQAPPFEAHALADTLIEFEDPLAEAVVHQYLPDINLDSARAFRAKLLQWRRPLLTRQ